MTFKGFTTHRLITTALNACGFFVCLLAFVFVFAVLWCLCGQWEWAVGYLEGRPTWQKLVNKPKLLKIYGLISGYSAVFCLLSVVM